MFDFPDFQTLVNKAFIAEREHKLVSDNRPANNNHKRKLEPRKEGKPVQKARTWQQTQVEYKPNWQQNVNKTTTQVKNVDQPSAQGARAQQFLLQLWANRTLCQTVSQEQQDECSIQATSQLYGIMPGPAPHHWARSSPLRR